MGDLRSSCEHLYSRIKNLQGELEFMKNKGQILSTESLDQYQTVVVKFLHFLERNGGKNLVYHVAKYTVVAGELKALHEDVSELFFDLLDVTAVDQWEKIAAAISDNSVALRDLQSPRAQLEAILTLKFELEKQHERHNQADMARMRSLMETIKTASRVSVEQLPAWFLPDYEVEFESQPFARAHVDQFTTANFASDVYSLAMCMIEATAGEPPFAYLDADDCGNQVGLKEESPSSCGSPGSPNTLVELNTDTSVVDLIDVLRSGPIDEQEMQFYYCYKPLSVTTSASRCSKKMEAPPDDEFEALGVLFELLQMLNDKLKTVVYCACAAEANGREPLLNAGAISRLVKLLGNGSETLAIWTMDALGNMASDDDTKNAIVAEGAIPMLVKLLQNGTETQRGFAAYVLGQLSINSASSTATIVESVQFHF
ncbi:Armadillo-type fold [Phytophthora cactorum]|nr:Armadillo-type fold [Phytophthora cactorum]